MNNIKVYQKIDAANITMIAGWPGMGNVALGVVDYLRKKLKVIKIADIELDKFAMLDSMVVEEGMARLPNPPKNTFYYSKEFNIIIMEGDLQLSGQPAMDLLNMVLDVAAKLNVTRIFTGAAFPLPVSYREEPEVYGVANKEASRDMLKRYKIKLMEGGHISGLNGLLLGFAGLKNIDAICLLATLPQYAISLPNPKASYALIETLSEILGFTADPKEMHELIREMDERMNIIEDKVKSVLPIDDASEKPKELPVEKKIPAYIMEKVEKMFLEAQKDKTKALVLKKELDRWDLYRVYEDRFLDLFKEGQ